MSTRGDVVAVTCLALEARIALGPGVSVICTHASQLIAALDRAARRGASGIISFGIAGGLAPHLAAGDWVVGSSVRTEQECFPTDRAWARALLAALPGALHAEIIGADAPVAHPLEKRRLHVRTGAVAVDNESHVAARIAAAYRIPFAACRAVIDPAHSELPPAAVTGLRHDGTADVLAVFRSVVRQPSQIPALARTALEALSAVLGGTNSLHTNAMDEVLAACGDLTEDALAQTAPLADLLGSTHDRLYSRLFQS